MSATTGPLDVGESSGIFPFRAKGGCPQYSNWRIPGFTDVHTHNSLFYGLSSAPRVRPLKCQKTSRSQLVSSSLA